MTSSTTKSFRSRFRLLPFQSSVSCEKNFKLWLEDPEHPSLPLKKIGRTGRHELALVIARWRKMQGDHAEWFWIGPHDEYERLLKE